MYNQSTLCTVWYLGSYCVGQACRCVSPHKHDHERVSEGPTLQCVRVDTIILSHINKTTMRTSTNDVGYAAVQNHRHLPDGFFVMHKGFIKFALLLEDRCQIWMCCCKLWENLQGLEIETSCFFNVALLPLDVGKIVERICMCRTQPQCSIITLLCFNHLTLFLEGICQIAVCIGEVGLQLNGTAICVNSQVNEPIKTYIFSTWMNKNL